jgi:aspartate aminotransferase-like enzyme
MFGPNALAISHRSRDFTKLYAAMERQMKRVFHLEKYDLIFIPGPGTLANEIVISSMSGGCDILFGAGGPGSVAKFTNRLVNMAICHGKTKPNITWLAFPLYETSACRYNGSDPEIAGRIFSHTNDGGFVFVDLVSSFPYYDIPEYADVWTTVSGKQLCMPPGVSIIGIRKGLNLEKGFEPPSGSILSLTNHLMYSMQSQTFTTPCISLFQRIDHSLTARPAKGHAGGSYTARLRSIINRRKKRIEKAYGGDVFGDGPVLGFKPSHIADYLQEMFELYPGVLGPEIFLWSGTEEGYELLCTDPDGKRKQAEIKAAEQIRKEERTNKDA